ncbi:trehalose-phosphatase [Mycobacterium paraterrae]|uniref:Trehalose 6-phosphate phosphatase n=1 Tax=Mycobacterium paraterrae TaxID=577492 RepID=A0ABY3VM54_9MYCO|nr:trehalose-phosphatase [Mycobacterium paraterrae]UMB68528.1 trehalose-phosphatase [Mycobacterium paraterrae]
MSVIIDPRRLDAVLFDAEPDDAFEARLREAGVRTSRSDAASFVESADRLGVRAGRCAVVTSTEDSASAARAAGFALVIDLATGHRIGDVVVRSGDRRMSELPDALQALDVTSEPAVFYDFDGTLSDIVTNPDTARLADGAAEALTSLSTRCPVAILSGRDLADVRERVGLPGLWYAGSHGFELTGPDGMHHQNDEAAAAIPVLAEAASELAEQLAGIAGVAVEHKRFGVAVHYRNAARDRVGEVTAAVRDAGQRTALRVTTGREVIELRPDVDWDKGKTLRWVLDYIRDNEGGGRLLPIYLGDDITDEDAFDAVADDGIAIMVRHTDDGDRATAAHYALDDPDQVREFTERLASQLDHKTACD